MSDDKPYDAILRSYIHLCGDDYFFPEVPDYQIMELQEHLGIIEKRQYQPRVHDRMHLLLRASDKLNLMQAVYPSDIEGGVGPQCCSGSSIDLISLLFGGQRDYLIRNKRTGGSNDYEVVKADSLKGKYVMVCCVFVPVYWQGSQSAVAHGISNACSDLYTLRTDFEVVIIVKIRPDFLESDFDHFLSGFPSSCLAVPFCDSRSRDLICKSVGFTRQPLGLLVDPSHNVLWRKPLEFFVNYGADAFPFSEKTLGAMSIERPNWEKMSLETLLCCFPSNMLTRNPGGGSEWVSISALKQTLVGVYLCSSGLFLPKLEEVYNYCKDQGKKFEIVVVHLPFRPRDSRPQLFQEYISRALEKRKMSCWMLPYRSWLSLKLDRMKPHPRSRKNDADQLVIFEPHGKFVEPYGRYIVEDYGLDAYPFTREAIIQREVERIGALTLESFLVSVYREGVEVPVTSLQGKNTLLYIDYKLNHNVYVFGHLLNCYPAMKAKNHSLKVIFIPRSPSGEFQSLPPQWLACPFHPCISEFVAGTMLKSISSAVIAFGDDGKVCSIFAHNRFCSLGADAYPFQNNLREEVMYLFHHINPSMPHL